jgi:antitoxin (DNA-binding transcriptional repressor) of toxin-antitoxin stability system
MRGRQPCQAAAAGLNPRVLLTPASIIDPPAPVIHICFTMKTATVGDLRNRFSRVAAWIAEGEPVEIIKSGKLFARLMPVAPAPKKEARQTRHHGAVESDLG